MHKSLIKFSFNQLINLNIHLGINQKVWNPLIYDLIIGSRQNHYFLNMNLTILNLRYSFLLIASLLKNNFLVLFYNNNIVLNKLLINHYRLFTYLKIFFGLGKWVNGFLNNFKLFRRQTLQNVTIIIRHLKRKVLKIFLKLNKNKLWNFLIFLRRLKFLPSGLFLMFPNHFAIFETLKLNIFSMSLIDVDKTESVYLALNYIIPFNYYNFYSLFFIFNNFKYLTLLNFVEKKKFFFFLIINLLKAKTLNFIKLNNLIFTYFFLLTHVKKKSFLKKYRIFHLLNYKNLI